MVPIHAGFEKNTLRCEVELQKIYSDEIKQMKTLTTKILKKIENKSNRFRLLGDRTSTTSNTITRNWKQTRRIFSH